MRESIQGPCLYGHIVYIRNSEVYRCQTPNICSTVEQFSRMHIAYADVNLCQGKMRKLHFKWNVVEEKLSDVARTASEFM